MEEEVWLPVKDYEGLYEVSNIGNIRALHRKLKKKIISGLPYIRLSKNGKMRAFSVSNLLANTFIQNPDITHNNEVWLPVKGFEYEYEISNVGDVRTALRNLNPHVLKHGYLQVGLSKNGESRQFLIHRLVLIAFTENPENKPHVNHINGITNDNRPSNLEWCTPKENVVHASNTGLLTYSKKVINTLTGIVYKSIELAAKQNKISKSALHKKVTGLSLNDTDFILYESGLSIQENIAYAIKSGSFKPLIGRMPKSFLSAKRIIDTHTGIIYDSINNAAKENKIPFHVLRRKIAGDVFNDTSFILYTSGLSAQAISEHSMKADLFAKTRKKGNARKVFDTNTGIIYKSIRHAAEKNKIERSSLYLKVTGKLLNNTCFILYESNQDTH